MADNPPDFKNIQVNADAARVSVDNFTQASTLAGQSLNNFTIFAQKVGSSLRDLMTGLKQANDLQENSHIMMKKSSDLLGLMASGALGASKAFSQAFQDTSGINNFGNQIEELAATASKTENGLLNMANALHMPLIDRFGKTIVLTTENVANFAKRVLEGPDAALKFQNAFLQMSAASGNLGKVFDQTGGGLGHLNDLLQTQAEMLAQATAATNTDLKTTSAYYTALGQIPGYLNSVTQATDDAGHRLNMLTATMQIAHGTGQDETTVLRDLTTAFDDYNASADQALDFTARISELSQKYNARLQDTRSYMTQTADAFKFLGENIDSSAQLFENYFGRLRETGLSTKAAADETTGLATSISQMSIAQKAFLSARTGGPGGLLGAVQIEQEIRQGKMADVMNKVEAALKQQFGRIVTQQEAATSEQAAAQFVKQRMFLMQGPFGALTGQGAEGEAKATRLLEAFAKPGGVTQERADQLLRDTVKRGSEVEQKSYTQFTQMNANLEAIKMLSGITALGVTQRALTPVGGIETALGRQLIGGIRDAMQTGRRATEAGGQRAEDRSSLYMSEGIQQTFKVIDNLGTSVDSIKQASSALFSSSGTMAQQQRDAYNKTFNDAHQHASRMANTVAQTHRRDDVKVADRLMAESNKQKGTPKPENITVTVNSVCPDCHKKFLTKGTYNNAPDFGPGF